MFKVLPIYLPIIKLFLHAVAGWTCASVASTLERALPSLKQARINAVTTRPDRLVYTPAKLYYFCVYSKFFPRRDFLCHNVVIYLNINAFTKFDLLLSIYNLLGQRYHSYELIKLLDVSKTKIINSFKKWVGLSVASLFTPLKMARI